MLKHKSESPSKEFALLEMTLLTLQKSITMVILYSPYSSVESINHILSDTFQEIVL